MLNQSKTATLLTHFGYEQVLEHEKAHKVAQVFDSVALNYDLMNDLMSLGLHRIWKCFALNISAIRPGQTVLDLACGTGDLSLQIAPLVGKTGRVFLADINSNMLDKARERLIDKGFVGNVHYLQTDAECLPFKENSLDCIIIGFGLRNVTRIEKALASMYQALKPGGRLLILEFSQPQIKALAPIYDVYSFTVLPFLGEMIVGDSASYRYLAESIRMHPNQETLKDMLSRANFDDVHYFNLSTGIVALHRGYKY